MENIHPNKVQDPVLCDSMGGPEGHYVKRNKPGSEREALHELMSLWDLKKKKKTLVF